VLLSNRVLPDESTLEQILLEIFEKRGLKQWWDSKKSFEPKSERSLKEDRGTRKIRNFKLQALYLLWHKAITKSRINPNYPNSKRNLFSHLKL